MAFNRLRARIAEMIAPGVVAPAPAPDPAPVVGGDEGNVLNHWFFKNPIYWILSFSALMSGFALVLNSVRSDPNHQAEVNRDINKAISDQEIARATGAAPPGYVFGGKKVGQVAEKSPTPPDSVQKTTITASTFSCGTLAEVEQGYAMRNIQQLDASSQSLHVGPGCVLTQVNGSISKINGKHYRLSVADDAIPGNYYNCGDMGGSNDSLSYCANFVNRWAAAGKEIRVAVLTDGYVNLN